MTIPPPPFPPHPQMNPQPAFCANPTSWKQFPKYQPQRCLSFQDGKVGPSALGAANQWLTISMADQFKPPGSRRASWLLMLDALPQPTTPPQPNSPTLAPRTSPLSTNQYCPTEQPEWSAYREPSFGNGDIEFYNATHARW
jgi:hypothetical protein